MHEGIGHGRHGAMRLARRMSCCSRMTLSRLQLLLLCMSSVVCGASTATPTPTPSLGLSLNGSTYAVANIFIGLVTHKVQPLGTRQRSKDALPTVLAHLQSSTRRLRARLFMITDDEQIDSMSRGLGFQVVRTDKLQSTGIHCS